MMAMGTAPKGGRTGDGHGHCAEGAGGLVQVQAVALEQQLHVGLAEVVRRIPKVELAVADPAMRDGEAPSEGLLNALTGQELGSDSVRFDSP